jgi:hypothetical protein
MPDEKFLQRTIAEYRQFKQKAESALAQESPKNWFRKIDSDANLLTDLVRHLSGSLRSRWRDFLPTDGEKADRHRDAEFATVPAESNGQLMARWESAWESHFDELNSLQPEDLSRTVLIHSETHTVPQAILRNVTHCAYHVGQIVSLTKNFAGSDWKTLNVPRGQSEGYNRKSRERPPGPGNQP